MTTFAVDPKREGRCIWCGDTTKATRTAEDGTVVRACKRCQKHEYPATPPREGVPR